MAGEVESIPRETVVYAKRKVPRQQRSRTTVESIKQAALLLLREEGPGGCGPERIAERAGVSVGSLYQYFPNRESILTALYEDISFEYAGILKSRIPKMLRLPTEQASVQTINMLFAMHDRHRLVLLQLVNEMPHLRLAEQPFSFHRLAQSSVRAYLVSHLGAMKPQDLDRMVFFVEQIILGCLTAFLREAQPRIARKAFTRDLSRIVTAYIDGWQGPSGHA